MRKKDRHEGKSGASSGLFVIENGTHAPIPLLRVHRNALDGRRLAECHLLAQTCVLAVLPPSSRRLPRDGSNGNWHAGLFPLRRLRFGACSAAMLIGSLSLCPVRIFECVCRAAMWGGFSNKKALPYAAWMGVYTAQCRRWRFEAWAGRAVLCESGKPSIVPQRLGSREKNMPRRQDAGGACRCCVAGKVLREPTGWKRED